MSLKERINHGIFLSSYIMTVYSLNIVMFPFILLKKLGINTNSWISMIYSDKQYMTSFLICKFLRTKTFFYFKKNIKKEDLFNNNPSRSITITNHLSEIDAIFIAMFLDEFLIFPAKTLTFAKEQLRYVPLIGWLLLNVGTIFVKNKNKTQNKQQHVYIEKKIKEEAEYSKNYNFNIFMEGTTFRQDIHEYRNQLDKRENGKIPEFKNIMVPRTEGLWLLETTINVDYEYFLGIKYILPSNMKDNEQGATQMLKGKYPSEVHIFVDKKPGKILDSCENREEFNNNVINEFKKIDDIIGDYNEWKNKYQSFEVNKSIFSWKMLRSLIVNGLAISLPFISLKFYGIYMLSLVSFNWFLGYIEFS